MDVYVVSCVWRDQKSIVSVTDSLTLAQDAADDFAGAYAWGEWREDVDSWAFRRIPLHAPGAEPMIGRMLGQEILRCPLRTGVQPFHAVPDGIAPPSLTAAQWNAACEFSRAWAGLR